jgi:hypothetical protein
LIEPQLYDQLRRTFERVLQIFMLSAWVVAVAALRWPAAPAVRLASPAMQLREQQRAVVPVQAPAFSGRVVSSKAQPKAPAAADSAILVQGGSLRTWSYQSPYVDQVQVEISTEGRPLDADIELWHGPDNTPCKMRVYIENGDLRQFSTVIETPRGPNTVAIRNVGQMEFPFATRVVANKVDNPSAACLAASHTVQGGALRTYPFETAVDSVQILLQTDGRPLNARIELLQGPNNNKQVRAHWRLARRSWSARGRGNVIAAVARAECDLFFHPTTSSPRI